jgi:hypothetical protein
MAFIDADKVELPQRAILSVEGMKGTGKSRFGLWGRAPVAMLRFDQASEGALRELRGLRKGAIKVSTFDFEKPSTEKKDNKVLKADDEIISMATKIYMDFVTDYRWALANGFKTIVVDDSATPWDLLRLIRLGKLAQVPPERYAFVNAEFKRLLKEALEHEATLVLLTPLREEWSDYIDESGKRKSGRTGKWEPTGFKNVDYLAHAIVRLYRAGDPTDPANKPLADPRCGDFCAEIRKCNENGMLVGQTVNFAEYAEIGIQNTFGIIMSMVYPNTEPSQWL